MSEQPRLKASDFDPEVMRLFDLYVHGQIDRRGFLTGAARFAVGATGAAGLLAALSPKFAEAQQVKPDDPGIATEHVEFESPGGNGKGRGYLCRPAKAAGKIASVLVIHENRGLNPHIEDVARRFALAGYRAFAPDALFTLGGYPGNEDDARALFQKLDADKTRQDMIAAYRKLASLDGGNGRIGAIGFCWGGGVTNFLATKLPELKAAAPFYGPAPPVDEVKNIKAKMLIVLAGNDERVNAGWPDYKAALEAAHVEYALFQPEGTQHGFNNDTTPRYDEKAAKEAWQRALALFGKTLKAA